MTKQQPERIEDQMDSDTIEIDSRLSEAWTNHPFGFYLGIPISLLSVDALRGLVMELADDIRELVDGYEPASTNKISGVKK